VGFTVDFQEDFVQMLLPIRVSPHPAHPIVTDFSGKHWAKSIPPEPNHLMADIDALLMQQILHIPERQRVAT
tara:strand:+ start:151 stop:366 length:216 start_codon:yes stop_codon:yes gene_type:complete